MLQSMGSQIVEHDRATELIAGKPCCLKEAQTHTHIQVFCFWQINECQWLGESQDDSGILSSSVKNTDIMFEISTLQYFLIAIISNMAQK